MAKVPASYRLDEPVKQTLEILSLFYSQKGIKVSPADVVQMLIIKDSIENLDKGYLEDTFGVDHDFLMQIYTSGKWR